MIDNGLFKPCICCSNESFHALPILPQTIISDGQLWDKPLKRILCDKCGATFHKTALTRQDMDKIYSTSYSLGAQSCEADARRTALYQEWITQNLNLIQASPLLNVLEIGCGNGLLAKKFQTVWPNAGIYGIEPAHQAAQHAANLGLNILEGTLDTVNLDTIPKKFDLIYSVNVIEHTLNPLLYLQQQAALLSDDGRIIVICPNAKKPNIEALFYDHITGFTDCSFSEIATRADLNLCHTETAPASIGNFQIAVFNKTPQKKIEATDVDTSIAETTKEKEDYFMQWLHLDEALCKKVANKNVMIFGAGEMTSIIRAFAPKFWSMVKCLVVDTPNIEEFHHKEVIALNQSAPSETFIFIAVRPDFGEQIEQRLLSLGYTTDSIHHYISD